MKSFQRPAAWSSNRLFKSLELEAQCFLYCTRVFRRLRKRHQQVLAVPQGTVLSLFQSVGATQIKTQQLLYCLMWVCFDSKRSTHQITTTLLSFHFDTFLPLMATSEQLLMDQPTKVPSSSAVVTSESSEWPGAVLRGLESGKSLKAHGDLRTLSKWPFLQENACKFMPCKPLVQL